MCILKGYKLDILQEEHLELEHFNESCWGPEDHTWSVIEGIQIQY